MSPKPITPTDSNTDVTKTHHTDRQQYRCHQNPSHRHTELPVSLNPSHRQTAIPMSPKPITPTDGNTDVTKTHHTDRQQYRCHQNPSHRHTELPVSLNPSHRQTAIPMSPKPITPTDGNTDVTKTHHTDRQQYRCHQNQSHRQTAIPMSPKPITPTY